MEIELSLHRQIKMEFSKVEEFCIIHVYIEAAHGLIKIEANHNICICVLDSCPIGRV